MAQSAGSPRIARLKPKTSPARHSTIRSPSATATMNGAAVCLAKNAATSSAAATTSPAVERRARHANVAPAAVSRSHSESTRTRSYQVPTAT